jgi:hypothetical protein
VRNSKLTDQDDVATFERQLSQHRTEVTRSS